MIAEIKSYDDSYWQRYLRENTIFDVDNIKAQKDWLISRIEFSEKALESANSKLGQISSKDFTNGQLRYEAATIIQEALQRIRE